MKKVSRTVFSGEFAYIIFLIGAVFKESLPFKFIDLTIAFLLISVAIYLTRIFKKPTINKKQLLAIAWYCVVIVLFLLSFTFSDSLVYGLDKLLRFMVITGWSFIGAILIIKDRDSLKRFVDGFILITLVGSVVILINTNNRTASGFIGLGGDNYLGSARMLGMGAVMILPYYLYGNLTKSKSRLILLSLLITLIALASTGARMPFISAMFLLIFMLLQTVRIDRKSLLIRRGTGKLLILFTLISIGLYLFKDAPVFQTTLNRLSFLLTDSTGGSSASERIRLTQSAIQLFKENPLFGVGLGGFGINYLGYDGSAYPHNIFLEFLVETGIVGFVLFLSVIIIAFVKVFKSFRTTDYLTASVSSTLIYMFINAMVSGDFNGNRTFFAFLGLALMLPLYIKDSPKGKLIQKEHKEDVEGLRIVWSR